jgi:hypothetical protein
VLTQSEMNCRVIERHESAAELVLLPLLELRLAPVLNSDLAAILCQIL